MVSLPPELVAALDDRLAGMSTRELSSEVRLLSERYRVNDGKRRFHATDAMSVEAYAAYRMPATFAAVHHVFREMRERVPALHPESLLDCGSGPGTAAWAALEVWPEIERIILLERDERMIELGKDLAASSGSVALRSAHWQRVDIRAGWSGEPADIVVAAYVAGELDGAARPALGGRLLEHTVQACTVVEPGTPTGYRAVEEVVSGWSATNARVVAPFPTAWDCLASTADWCHFAVRVPRTRIHRLAKSAALPYEDEKYSYAVATPLPSEPIAARVVRQPQVRQGHVRLVLCTPDGLREVVVPRSRGDGYRLARRLEWGSALSSAEAVAIGVSA